MADTCKPGCDLANYVLYLNGRALVAYWFTDEEQPQFQRSQADIVEIVGTLLAQIDATRRTLSVTRKLCLLMLVLSMALAVGCSKSNGTEGTASANSNNATTPETSTRPGPDNSEITTKVDANGVKTEERVFHNNPRISRVVVTTANGKRTVKAYSAQGEEREVSESDSEGVLEATADKVADGAHFVADKSKDVGEKAKDVGAATKDKAEDIGSAAKEKTEAAGAKTVDTAKTVGEKSKEGAKTVGEKSKEGAQTVGEKSVEGAKTVGSKTKKAVKKIIP
jgi:hypothetical protein